MERIGRAAIKTWSARPFALSLLDDESTCPRATGVGVLGPAGLWVSALKVIFTLLHITFIHSGCADGRWQCVSVAVRVRVLTVGAAAALCQLVKHRNFTNNQPWQVVVGVIACGC